MSTDPHRWVEFGELSDNARERIKTIYPYLKIEHCQFQEKPSGVFMKQANSVKVEKLLDPTSAHRRQPLPALTPSPAVTATSAAAASPPPTTRVRRG